MKLLVLSDNHGLELKPIIENHTDVDHILHCGDSLMSSEEIYELNMICVSGNNDKNEQPDMQILNFDCVRILLTHGHLEDVNSSLLSLGYLAKENDIDIVCFGHTHYVALEEVDNVVYINPGALYNPFSKYGKTYALITLNIDTIKVEIFNPNKERLITNEYRKRNSSKSIQL